MCHLRWRESNRIPKELLILYVFTFVGGSLASPSVHRPPSEVCSLYWLSRRLDGHCSAVRPRRAGCSASAEAAALCRARPPGRPPRCSAFKREGRQSTEDEDGDTHLGEQKQKERGGEEEARRKGNGHSHSLLQHVALPNYLPTLPLCTAIE